MLFSLKECGFFAARQTTNFIFLCRGKIGNYAIRTFECRACGGWFHRQSLTTFHVTTRKNFKFYGCGVSPRKGLLSASILWISPFKPGRNVTSGTGSLSTRHKTVALYVTALAILVGGGSYAAVPLYRLYCQASGLGGTVKKQDVVEKIEAMEKQEDRKLTIRFNADTSATMRWNFRPQQSQIKLVPGETALAFYTAKNPTSKPITGVSTYNVIPFEAAQYFNKIQCFCFEEQRLNPHEEVDMPVFFYIDPEFTEDPAMYKIDTITLSYTFFEAKEGLELPLPVH